MGLIRDLRNIDFAMIDEPWTEEEFADFRMLVRKLKKKRATVLRTKPISGTRKQEIIRSIVSE